MNPERQLHGEIPRSLPPARRPDPLPVAAQPRGPSRYTALLCGAALLLGAAAWERRNTIAAPDRDARAFTVHMSQQDVETVPGAAGETRYYCVTLYDSHDEDGDVVELRMENGAAFSSFVLTRRGHRVLVPAPSAGGAVLVVKALKDGSRLNKVSFAAKTSMGAVSSRILAEGEEQIIRLEAVR